MYHISRVAFLGDKVVREEGGRGAPEFNDEGSISQKRKENSTSSRHVSPLFASVKNIPRIDPDP